MALALLAVRPADAAMTGTIPLQGLAGTVCSIVVNPDPNALTLPITTAGSQTVTVGTVVQNCNFPTGYSLTVADIGANCNAAPVGAKLTDGGANYLSFSVDSVNPGPTTVTGLIQSACLGQIARNVTTITPPGGDTSTIQVLFTGNTGLVSGTYSDTLTLTMATH